MATAEASGILRRDRTIALTSLLGVAALAWIYLWVEAARMGTVPMAGMGTLGEPSVWRLDAVLLIFLMWAIMMVGMMLPSATPAILLYGSMVRKNRERGSALPSVWIFTAGYIAVWTGFSLAATALQRALEAGALLTPMMVSNSAWLSGALLILAGLYQWLPIKDACLRKCRAPLQFFMFHWRSGSAGAFGMGAQHGAYCVGCCWALMLLLFVAGVMDLLWVAVIAAFVLAEKLLPAARLTGRLVGVAMAALGVAVLLTA